MSHDNYPRHPHEREDIDLVSIRRGYIKVRRGLQQLRESWDSSKYEDLVTTINDLDEALENIETTVEKGPSIGLRLSPQDHFNLVALRASINDGKGQLGMV